MNAPQEPQQAYPRFVVTVAGALVSIVVTLPLNSPFALIKAALFCILGSGLGYSIGTLADIGQRSNP